MPQPDDYPEPMIAASVEGSVVLQHRRGGAILALTPAAALDTAASILEALRDTMRWDAPPEESDPA